MITPDARVEAVAKAIFEYQHGDREWERELAILDGPKRNYSLAPTYRALAGAAVAAMEKLDGDV